MRRPRREPRPFFLGHRTQARLCAPITTACHHPRTTSSMRLYRARRRGGSAINVLRAAARQPLPGAPPLWKVGRLSRWPPARLRWTGREAARKRPDPSHGYNLSRQAPPPRLGWDAVSRIETGQGSRTGGGLASAGVDAYDLGELRLQSFDLARQLDRWEQLGALSDNG